MDFEAFPKIARLNRDIVVTEKIDGTNAAIVIEEVGPNPSGWQGVLEGSSLPLFGVGDAIYRIGAQSRKRLITPDSDNFGFARWVRENAEELVQLMGPGRHFGEWWGQGIQRGYGMTYKKFSLFNPTFRFDRTAVPGGSGLLYNEIDTVPVLYEGPFDQSAIRAVLSSLEESGSVAAPGFVKPEGVVIFHTASRGLFKATIENDEAPKGSIHWGGDGV